MAKIGVEWVQKYHGRASNLSNTKDQAEGLYNRLSGTRSFNWGDDMAWDQDFEQSGTGSPTTGTDATWADNVSIVFFSGHGSSAGPMFGLAGFDDGLARPSEMRLGDGDLEWLVIDACEVLNATGVWTRVEPIFRGLHYVLGFHTVSSDESKRGRYLADNLDDGQNFRRAWRNACQETEGSGRQYAYMRADNGSSDTYRDHWHGKGFVSSDPTSPTRFFYLRSSC
jgi:hypothetical protein